MTDRGRTELLEDRMGPWAALRLTLWVALVASWVEVASIAYRTTQPEGFVGRSREFAWMIPAGYLLVFLVPGLVLALAARFSPWRVTSATVAGIAALGASVALLVHFAYGKLHWAALLLLGVGVALQVARLTRRVPDSMERLTKATWPWLAGGTLAVALVMSGLRILGNRAGGSETGNEARPNVVLLILDTVRARSLGLYGNPRPTTPRLDSLARGGVAFDWAMAPAPWTLPSHASIFTGQWPNQLSASWRTPLDDSSRTLAEAFSEAGYSTGGFVANLAYATWEHGISRGFDHYEDYLVTWANVLRSVSITRRLTDARRIRPLIGSDELFGRKPADQINSRVLDWVDRVPQPFLLFVNYFDAHDPYLPPDEFFRRITGGDRPDRMSPFRRYGLGERANRATPEEVQYELDSYEAAIAWLDHEVGALVDSLESRGLLNNTLIVVTSDHGEEFGEHGTYLHGHTVYADALHVPLVMLWPGVIPAGRRISHPVSLRDLAATIAISALSDSSFPGNPLVTTWTDSAPGTLSPAYSQVDRGIRVPTAYPGAKRQLHSLLQDGWQYLCNPQQGLLYHLTRDPEGEVDLSLDSTDLRDDLAATASRIAALAGYGRPATLECTSE